MASDAIKPEDIGAEIIDAVEDKCGCGSGAWDCIPETELIAAILNAAIEAGLVSPPVWAVIADEDSPDFKNAEGPINPVYLTTTKQEAEFRIREDILDVKKTRVEHWKRQTK